METKGQGVSSIYDHHLGLKMGVFSSLGVFLSSGALVSGDRGVAGSWQKCHASWPDFWGAFMFSVAPSLSYCIPDICVVWECKGKVSEML